MTIHRIVMTAIIIVLASSAVADEKTNTSSSFSHMGYVSLGGSSFDSRIALEEGVADTATTLRIGWNGQQNLLLVGAGMGFLFYSDNEGFSERIRDIYGDSYRENSSALGYTVYGEAGLAFSLSENLSLDALVGGEYMIESERSISSCSNCFSEDIDIESGLYINPRFRVQTSNGFNFMLSFRQYLSGDINNSLSVGFGWVFWNYL